MYSVSDSEEVELIIGKMSQSQTQKQDITLEFKAYTLIGNSLKSQSQMYVKESFSYKSLSI